MLCYATMTDDDERKSFDPMTTRFESINFSLQVGWQWIVTSKMKREQIKGIKPPEELITHTEGRHTKHPPRKCVVGCPSEVGFHRRRLNEGQEIRTVHAHLMSAPPDRIGMLQALRRLSTPGFLPE